MPAVQVNFVSNRVAKQQQRKNEEGYQCPDSLGWTGKSKDWTRVPISKEAVSISHTLFRGFCKQAVCYKLKPAEID